MYPPATSQLLNMTQNSYSIDPEAEPLSFLKSCPAYLKSEPNLFIIKGIQSPSHQAPTICAY